MSTDTDRGAGLFRSPAALRAAFEQGLDGLLHHDLLGAFILVLANASLEREMLERLRKPLETAFDRWCARFERGDQDALTAAADDQAVFKRLREFGLENLAATRSRRLGVWEIQFNQLRAFRPVRMSGTPVTELRRPFDPGGFHFNRPVLNREILWEGELCGAPVRLLYNKFPFAALHGLLVPYPEAGRPQFLERQDHALLWEIGRALGARLPGVGFGYNAHGAHASVNHLHFQMFLRPSGAYAIESGRWRHNGGSLSYPLDVQRHDDPDRAWAALCELHAAGICYNLLYRPGRVYLVPRAMQGSYRHSDWTGGFAWSEVAGTVTTSDIAAFDRLTTRDIEAEVARLAVPRR